MKRTFSVHRVFPLGEKAFKNVQFTNVAEYGEDEEVPPAGEVYRALVGEIYDAFFDHVKEVRLMESVKTIDEKEEVWRHARGS